MVKVEENQFGGIWRRSCYDRGRRQRRGQNLGLGFFYWFCVGLLVGGGHSANVSNLLAAVATMEGTKSWRVVYMVVAGKQRGAAVIMVVV